MISMSFEIETNVGENELLQERFVQAEDGNIIALDPEVLANFNQQSCPQGIVPNVVITILPPDDDFVRLRVNRRPRKLKRFAADGSPSLNAQLLSYALERVIVRGETFSSLDAQRNFPKRRRNLATALSDMTARGILARYQDTDTEPPGFIYDLPSLAVVVDASDGSSERPVAYAFGALARQKLAQNVLELVYPAPEPESAPPIVQPEKYAGDISDPNVQIKLMIDYVTRQRSTLPFSLEDFQEMAGSKQTIKTACRIADLKGGVDSKRENRLEDWLTQL